MNEKSYFFFVREEIQFHSLVLEPSFEGQRHIKGLYLLTTIICNSL